MIGNPPIKIKDPHQIRFIHQTISPTLSKPKPGEIRTPHLDAIAREIENGVQSMLAFPPIEIFSIRDPLTNEKAYFSLNNRKLYLAKKSHSVGIKTVKATFAQILESTWKMTSMSDGLAFPNPTQEGNKECKPTGLLLQFREFLSIRNQVYPLNMKKDDDQTVAQRIFREAQETFHLKCHP